MQQSKRAVHLRDYMQPARFDYIPNVTKRVVYLSLTLLKHLVPQYTTSDCYILTCTLVEILSVEDTLQRNLCI